MHIAVNIYYPPHCHVLIVKLTAAKKLVGVSSEGRSENRDICQAGQSGLQDESSFPQPRSHKVIPYEII